jgi:hypothetical protein
MAEVFTEFLGTDHIDLDIHGSADGTPGNLAAVHHFDTADQLRQEVIARSGAASTPPVERSRRPSRTEGRALWPEPRLQIHRLNLIARAWLMHAHPDMGTSSVLVPISGQAQYLFD